MKLTPIALLLVIFFRVKQLWMPFFRVTFLLVAVTPLAGHAQSTIVIGGSGSGHECFRRAELSAQLQTAEPEDVKFCTDALATEASTPSNRAALLVNRGVLLAALQDLDAAEASYQEALELSDDIGETHINIGNLYSSQKHYQRALDHYTLGIPLMRRKLHVAYLNRGLAYEHMENYSAALADYERALSEYPDWLKAKKMFARVQAKTKP